MWGFLLLFLVQIAYGDLAEVWRKTNKKTRTDPVSKSTTLPWLMIISDIILSSAEFLIDPSCAEE